MIVPKSGAVPTDRIGKRSCRHFHARTSCSPIMASGTKARNSMSAPARTERKRSRSKRRSNQASVTAPIRPPAQGSHRRWRRTPVTVSVTRAPRRRRTLSSAGPRARLLGGNRASTLDFAKLAAFDEANELVPFGMRQPDGVFVLADRDTLLGDLDRRAFRAKRAQGDFDGIHGIGFLLARLRMTAYCL